MVKKIFLIVFKGIGVLITLMFTFLILATIFAFTYVIRITDTQKYLKTDGFLSEFILFPENLENIEEIVDYHYFDYQLRDGREVVLIAKYNESSYYEEIDRLENIYFDVENSYSGPKYIMKDFENVLFNKPTYVTTYIPGRTYEYACIDDATYTISYFFIEFMSKERVSVSSEFLPKIYTDDNELYSRYCYDIYMILTYEECEEYSKWIY